MTTSAYRNRKSFSPSGLAVRYYLKGARPSTLHHIDLTLADGRAHMAAQLRDLRAQIRKESEGLR